MVSSQGHAGSVFCFWSALLTHRQHQYIVHRFWYFLIHMLAEGRKSRGKDVHTDGSWPARGDPGDMDVIVNSPNMLH